mmetsp:Transcript_23903/g.71340  ORF Transcript_23903/g.71340 Transcript_23903/m.71340 type:complete len:412 (+) Transcript_23903:184-1419(+)
MHVHMHTSYTRAAMLVLIPAIATAYVMPPARTEAIVSVQHVAPGRILNNGCDFWDYGIWTLDCSNKGLTKLPSASLWPMRKGIHLWFDNNGITEIKADSFSQSTEVQFLFLDNNEITVVEPGAFATMTQLRLLSLADNDLEKMPPISMLPHLYILDVHGNWISETLTAASFPSADTSELRYVNLADNAVVEVGCGTFNAVPNVLHVDMAGNPSQCTVDAFSREIRCDCQVFSKGALTGGELGYCSTSCDERVATPLRTDGDVKPLQLAHSSERVLSLLRRMNTVPDFRDAHFSQSTDSVDPTVPAAQWSAETIIVVAVASIFLMASLAFTISAINNYSSTRQVQLINTVDASSTSDAYTAYNSKTLGKITTRLVSDAPSSSDNQGAPIIFITAADESIDGLDMTMDTVSES